MTFKSALKGLLKKPKPHQALYAGLGGALVGGVPGTVIYLSGYEYIKDLLSTPGSSKSNFVSHLAAGMGAEALACVIYVPVDVVKERMQVQQLPLETLTDTEKVTRRYNNSFHALKQIVKTEGVRGIYRGYGATLLSFGPFSALYFVFYEHLKEKCTEYYFRENNSNGREQQQQILPFSTLVGLSASAGAIASYITSPLDMAKLRMQIARRDEALLTTTNNYSTLQTSLKTIVNEGGVKNLWKGSMSRVMFFAPATAISMGIYEVCKHNLSERWEEK